MNLNINTKQAIWGLVGSIVTFVVGSLILNYIQDLIKKISSKDG